MVATAEGGEMGEKRSIDEQWRELLTNRLEGLAGIQRAFRRIPSAPRCKICMAPFSGFGGRLVALLGFRRWAANATLCTICVRSLEKDVGGAEVEATFLFADIRGSTGLAERLSPAQFQQLLSRFYTAAARAVDAEQGVVDKFLGDGVVALFVPVFSGDGGPAASAIAAGLRLLRAVGDVPVGVGVHTGPAYVGVLGDEHGKLDFTGVGDTVNIAARLGSEAAAGQLLASTTSAQRANLDTSGLEHRTLALKGREEPVEVVVLSPATATARP